MKSPMSHDGTVERRNILARLQRAPRPGPDERDATIELLERTLADEREAAAALQKEFDALRFRLEVLERSYAKQLAEARERCAAAERAVADQQGRNATVEEELAATVRQLADAKDMVERLWASAGCGRRPRPSDADPAESTINALLGDASWLDPKGPPPDAEGPVYSRVKAEDAVPENEMIAPDLVFPGGDEEEDD